MMATTVPAATVPPAVDVDADAGHEHCASHLPFLQLPRELRDQVRASS